MRRLGAPALALGLVAVTACGGKKKKPAAPPPEVTGLAAVPASAVALVAADVGKLGQSQLIERAIDQLLLTDITLADRWADVQTHCKIDPRTQLRHLMLALGPPPAQTGSGPVLLVATGAVSETELVACIPKIVGTGAGGLTTKSVGGRSLYQVKDGNRVMFFAFGRPDTIVLGTQEAWVLDALGGGKKALDNPELATWLDTVDQKSPLWAIGKVDPRVGQGLVDASDATLTSPPQALVATLDPRDGMKADFRVLMASADQAKQLESFAQKELGLFTMAAQLKSLGAIVAKLKVATEGSTVRFSATLTQADVNQLLSVLDDKPAPEQGTPAPGAGVNPAPSTAGPGK